MLAFIHIEKTAGTTIHQIMGRTFGAQHCQVEHWDPDPPHIYRPSDYNRLKNIYPNLKSIGGHPIQPHGQLHEIIDDLTYFTFLRDPLKRCASQYQQHFNLMGRASDFEEWVKEYNIRDFQTRKIAGERDFQKAKQILKERVQFVGLTERFDLSLRLIKDRLCPQLDITHRPANKAKDNQVKNRILNEKRSVLKQVNQQDLKLYNYVQDRIFPEQKDRTNNLLQNDVKNSSLFYPYNKNYLMFSAKKYFIYKPKVVSYREALPDKIPLFKKIFYYYFLCTIIKWSGIVEKLTSEELSPE